MSKRQEVGTMQMWKKVVIGTVSAITIAGGANLANLAALAAGSNDAPRIVDVKGPCDEAEHAGDPRCAGVQVREDDAREQEPGDDRGREQEARGREAEGEREAEDEREAEHEADDSNRGPNRGPSDDSGRSGNDDGSGHDPNDDHGGDD